MFFMDDGVEERHLLTLAVQALADLKNPPQSWIKKHKKIYLHSLNVREEDKEMHRNGWRGSNGCYTRPHKS